MQEWSRLEKDTARVIFVGDLNRVDEAYPALWNSSLSATCCIDIDPKLITLLPPRLTAVCCLLNGSRLLAGTQHA